MDILTLIKKCMWFVFFLLAILMLLGTFTQELIVRSFIIHMRQSGWLEGYENIVVILLFSFCIFFSILFAKWLTVWLLHTKDSKPKTNMLIVGMMCIGLTLAYWLMPRDTAQHKNIISNDGRFVGGSYPDMQKLKSLKEQGYTAVISLLDPLVLPYEPFLINDENLSARSVGIPLIRIPMLPGGIKSINADKKITALAANNNSDKYYVHGYYGQDRVQLFIDTVNKVIPIVEQPDIEPAKTVRPNSFTLERGNGTQVDNHLVISPMPTDNELEYLLAKTPNQYIHIPIHYVVSINSDEKPARTLELTNKLKSLGLEFISMPIPRYPYDTKKVLEITNKVKALPGGVFVYSYYMPAQSATLSGFLLSYLTDLPALPKALFDNEPMQGGEVKLLAPNIAIGPRPGNDEFANYLQVKGIKAVVWVGQCGISNYKEDENLAKSANLKWVCTPPNNDIIYKEVLKGGPWYVYGPDAGNIESSITQHVNQTKLDSSLFEQE